MARLAHPGAMGAHRPEPTRTARARMAPKFPGRGRYLSYMLFGATSFFYAALGLLVLRIAWALGSGPEAWAALQRDLAHPLYLAFHAVAFVVFVWAGWRFLIKLAPKANPPRIGPVRRPPLEVFPPLLGAVWAAASVLVLVVLWGIVP